jgi:hypothetical protein
MKVAILLRGIVRPDYKRGAELVTALRTIYSNFDISFYLHAWETDEAKKLADTNEFKEVCLIPEPTKEEALSILKARMPVHRLNNGWWLPENTYRYLYGQREATQWMADKDYDYITWIRPDLRMWATDPLPTNSEMFTPNMYRFPNDNVLCMGNRVYVSDQAGTAKPSLLQAAWDYRDNITMNHLVGTSINGEHLLSNLLELNRVPYRPTAFPKYYIRK